MKTEDKTVDRTVDFKFTKTHFFILIAVIIVCTILITFLTNLIGGSNISTELFIGLMATFMGILITFVLGFQIINTFDITNKLYEFQKKEKEEHVIFKNDIDENIKKRVQETENKFNEQYENLYNKMEVKLINTKLVSIRVLSENAKTKLSKTYHLVNYLLLNNKHNCLCEKYKLNKEINWEFTNEQLRKIDDLFKQIINDFKDKDQISIKDINSTNNDIESLRNSYKDYLYPFEEYTNALENLMHLGESILNKTADENYIELQTNSINNILIKAKILAESYIKQHDKPIENTQS